MLSLDELLDSIVPVKEKLSVNQIPIRNIFISLLNLSNINWQLAEA